MRFCLINESAPRAKVGASFWCSWQQRIIVARNSATVRLGFTYEVLESIFQKLSLACIVGKLTNC